MSANNVRFAEAARLGTAAIVLVAASLGFAACTSARNALGPHESPCFRTLAVAHAAVNDEGRFAGVRYLSTKDLMAALREMKTGPKNRFAVPAGLQHERSAICVVAYRGRFSTSDVALGWPPNRHGDPLAIVIVRVRDVRVLVTFVLKRPPLRFTRFLPSV
jgi:hypothetical protein